MTSGQTVLFIPVSQKLGSGEYYRCLSLARSLKDREPSLDIHICVNRHADVPHPEGLSIHTLEDSPTYCTQAIQELIEQINPSVAVFDNTLRLSQLKACWNNATRTVFLSSRPKKRRTGFSPRKLRRLDEHWIVGSPNDHHLKPYETLLLKAVNSKTRIRFFAAMQPQPDMERLRHFLEAQGAAFTDYVLFAPGGGSGFIEGYPTAELFQRAAREFERSTQQPTLFVAGPMSEVPLESTANRLEIRATSPTEFVDLIHGARVFVTGAGSQLWQALVMHKPCVAIPATGKEQPKRLAAMLKQKVVKSCERSPEALARAAQALFDSGDEQSRLSERTVEAGYREGVHEACESIIHLAGTRSIQSKT